MMGLMWLSFACLFAGTSSALWDRLIAVLVGGFFGWLLALFTPFAIEGVRRRWHGPKLECKVWADETPTNINQIRQLYVSVRVTNVKPRIARQCRGYLLRIEEMRGDRPIRTVIDTTAQCIWEYDEKRDAFDIPCGAKPSFNAVMYQDGVQEFRPQIRTSTGQLLSSIRYEEVCGQYGKFRFSGIVTGDEVSPVPFAFDVEWNGQWPPVINAAPNRGR